MEWHSRFDAKWMPEPMSGCWLWFGATTPDGYGQMQHNGKRKYAHRLAYERWVGPIPTGLKIDHVRARGCSSRACVNPEHLEPVTNRVNILRGDTLPATYAQRTHCARGHELSGSNLIHYVRRGRREGRCCRACKNERSRARARALREKACHTGRTGEDGTP